MCGAGPDLCAVCAEYFIVMCEVMCGFYFKMQYVRWVCAIFQSYVGGYVRHKRVSVLETAPSSLPDLCAMVMCGSGDYNIRFCTMR